MVEDALFWLIPWSVDQFERILGNLAAVILKFRRNVVENTSNDLLCAMNNLLEPRKWGYSVENFSLMTHR